MFQLNQENSQLRRLVFVLAITVGVSCSQKKEEPTHQQRSTNLLSTVTEPVYRDFADIKRSGVLRMITSYSSNTYFLHRGIQAGFEYEFIRDFAKENDLALEVVIAGENDNPFDLLNSGEGDIIAANYTITEERKEVVSFTRPYNLVDQFIVVSSGLGIGSMSISALSEVPITVRRNSSYYVRLRELQEEGFELNINLVPDDMDTEALLFQVANGTYAATVADDNMYQAAKKYMAGLETGPMIAQNDTIAWAIRQGHPDLEAKLNRYLYKHFRFDQNRLPKRSAFLNVLRKKYFESGSQIADYFSPEFQTEQVTGISPYDSLIQVVANEYDLDWLMMTAVAAQESKFDPYSESWAGAVGIMQILPRFSEISEDSLYIPEVNIREGARILKEHLEHYAYLDSTEQWKLALATYNAGLGHLADARRLAIDHNKNPNEWENVSQALLRLMQRKYYQNARFGFCRGIETVRYVNEIMNRYETYEAILALSRTQNSRYPGVFGVKTVN